MPQYKVNDSVRYKPVGAYWNTRSHLIGYLIIGPQSHTSETVGVIKEVLTSPGNLTGRQVQATEQDPRYEIENSHTHKRTAIKESNIIEHC
ncbi:hypothetical protein DPV78_002708 [Talaromyces pinophilus]|nr:hypothetical protein DPV78_002708 [Talaromyces pinophilus]